MTDAERAERMLELLDDEQLTGDQKFWWLSFADNALPKGSQFLGVAIVRAPGPMSAIRQAHLAGCNPGGECAMQPAVRQTVPPDGWLNRLIVDRDEIDRLGTLWLADTRN